MKRHWTHEDLVEHFTLLPAERDLIAMARGDHTRLGLAVLLKSFQLDGRFPATPHEAPTSVVAFLAQQLALDPLVFGHYDWWGRVIDDHRRLIRETLGVRAWTNADTPALISHLTEELLRTHSRDIGRLRARAYAYCQAQQLEPPTAKKLDRAMHSALATYDDQFCARISTRLSPATTQHLDALLTTIEPAHPDAQAPDPAASRRALFHILKSDPGPLTVETAKEEVFKLLHLRGLGLPSTLFADVPPRVVRALRQRAVAEDPQELRRHAPARRSTLLAAFAWQRLHEVTDALVDLLIKMIQQIGVKAERTVEKALVAELKKVANKTGILRKLVTAAVEHPDGIVREVLYPIVGEHVLKDLAIELGTTERVVERAVQTKVRRSYGRHYRRMVPPILKMLQFRSTNDTYRPLIDAIDLLTRYADNDDSYYDVDETVPIAGVVPAAWRAEVIVRDRGSERVRRIPYEICVLQSLREKLRGKEIWVEGAGHYRNPADDLPADFAAQRAQYYAALDLPLDADSFIASLQQMHRDALRRFHDGLPTNQHVKILPKSGGWIELAPLTAQPEPPHLDALKGVIADRWPTTSLLDMLKETALRTDFLELFRSLTAREHLDRDTIHHRLLLCLYGLGANTGLRRMSAGNAGVNYKDLVYMRRRFITRDYLRAAIQTVANGIFQIRLPSIWGEATTSCASDSKKFGAWEQNLITEWHNRYGGRGVVIYWHVEKKATCIYSQLKQCSSSEVAAAITGVIRHCTEMQIKQHYVDSHGQSEVAFGMCHLLGYDLCPRLKPIHSQKLYLVDSADTSCYPHLKLVLTRSIDWILIRQEYDELVKYATAIQSGTAEAEAILARFTRQATHPTYKAFAELGRVIKTVFLCRYLHAEAFRREIQEGLNVVENWNSANSFIFYGRHGEIATNRREDQEIAMLALHLLQISLVYVNTLMIQDVLRDPGWLARLTAEDYRALTPLIYSHVNPYGTFQLDMTTRLPIAETLVA